MSLQETIEALGKRVGQTPMYKKNATDKNGLPIARLVRDDAVAIFKATGWDVFTPSAAPVESKRFTPPVIPAIESIEEVATVQAVPTPAPPVEAKIAAAPPTRTIPKTGTIGRPPKSNKK